MDMSNAGFDPVSYAMSKENLDKALEKLSGKTLLEVTVTNTNEQNEDENDNNNNNG